jgi:NAD(P)H dehydrogenase (quinone)
MMQGGFDMNVFIVYAHPGTDSFTRHVKDSFIMGLEAAVHTYVLSDLYAMGFVTDMSGAEYNREAYYRGNEPVPEDVAAEQAKVNGSNAIVFIYPVFWTDAPAKLKGWFDRVWTFGFAYGDKRAMKQLDKGLALCVSGHTVKELEETGLKDSMEKVMLYDRMYDRVKSREMIILGGMSREMESRHANWDKHLQMAYEAGRTL